MSKRRSEEVNIDINFNVSIRMSQLQLNNKKSRTSNDHVPVKVNINQQEFNVNINGDKNDKSAKEMLEKIDLIQLAKKFIRVESKAQNDPNALLRFYKKQFKWMEFASREVLPAEMQDTIEWGNAVKGRITENLVHSAAESTARRTNPLLVSKILGTCGVVTRSESIKNRTEIKEKVLHDISDHWESHGHYWKKCGLYLTYDYPMFSATCDAISEKFVYKIYVCHTCDSDATFKRLSSAKFTESETDEMQFIMHITNRKEMYIFIVPWNYSEKKTIKALTLKYDEQNAENVLEEALDFWNREVFPMIIQAAKI
uniref:CSON004025 protein n=1 Tax=Culicoides sonorensis TaxID=179676 RepID=A0A336K755_CULSO